MVVIRSSQALLSPAARTGQWAAILTHTNNKVDAPDVDEEFGSFSLTDRLVCPIADYRLHVLRHHAEQVGPADLPARLHEEPPGLPPRPPRSSVALLQLHVHARRVRASLRFAAGTVARRKRTFDPFLLLCSVQPGAAGLQRFAAAHDRRSLGDGSWHRTHQSTVHGRSARWWGSFEMHMLYCKQRWNIFQAS